MLQVVFEQYFCIKEFPEIKYTAFRFHLLFNIFHWKSYS